ncbi:MAG: helix-turn-helix transcriptional regulator, partial [Mailhella sp.]|nr:helix-turn-helix transcriptional regulator [Mailhella sp.]
MPDYRNMTAIEVLRYAKEQSGKTAEEISEAFGASTAVVTRYFRSADGYGPSLDKLPRLCKALGNTILVDWLKAQTQEADDMPAAQSRAEVLTAVARAMAALGEVSKLLVETENCGIDPEQARAIRSGLDDVKLACSVTQGMLDEL